MLIKWVMHMFYAVALLIWSIKHVFCLFGVFRPIPEFLTFMETSHCWWRAANVDLRSARMSIEQLRFFSVPQLLNTGHPYIMVITENPWHTYCWAFSWGAVTTCFYDLCLSRLGFEHPTVRLRGERSNRLHRLRGLNICALFKCLFCVTYMWTFFCVGAVNQVVR